MAESAAVAKTAWPAASSATVASGAVPSRKVMVPVGFAAPAPVTVAVNVTV